jgi:amino acid transporter
MLLNNAKLLALAAVIIAAALLFFPAFSIFAAALGFSGLALGLAAWVDKRFMPQYDTFDLRKEAPHDTMAGAVIFLGVCVLIGCALLASGGAFAALGT